jgi:hypothetical protein
MIHLRVWLYNWLVAPLLAKHLEDIIKENLREYYKNQRDNHQELMKVQLDNQAIVSAAYRNGDDSEKLVERRHQEFIEALKDISNSIGQTK